MSLLSRVAFLVFGFILCGWLYWLTARTQRCLDHAEAALDHADLLIGALQRRMATRGVLAMLGDDAPPTPVNLPLTPVAVAEAVTDEATAGITAAVGERLDTQPQPTVPTVQAIDSWQRALAQDALLAPSVEPDDVDDALSRFRFNPGHTRSQRREEAALVTAPADVEGEGGE